MNVSTSQFQQLVIEASRETPVLVDFWAPWCGPCRFLGPVLEKLEAEQEPRWTLAKVNTDENPDLSKAFNIRGIPAVKMFVDGVVVDEFTGALPENAIRQWLDKALPTESTKKLEKAKKLFLVGENAAAVDILEEILRDEPTQSESRILLAGEILFQDPERAMVLAQGGAFAGSDYLAREQTIQVLGAVLTLDPTELPDGDGRDSYTRAVYAIQEMDFETAFEALIESIRADRYYFDDIARKTGVSLFSFVGPDHALSKKYRRTFDMWLY